MSYNIFPTRRFEKELKRLVKKYPSLKLEYFELVAELSKKPDAGTFIGKSCYKIRLAIASKGKGKSGGARVITHWYIATKSVYLLTIYDKAEKTDLKPNELVELIDSLEL